MQTACPAAEAILFVAEAVEDGACAHDQQTAQVAVAGLGDPPQSCLAAAAVLPRRQSDPGRHLAAVLEVVAVADAGQQCAGGDRADAGALHQAFAARIFARRLGDEPVVLGDPCIELVGVGEQIADARLA